MTFAEKLKTIRRQAGLSQEQLADKLNVSRQAITKWETGAGIPDIGNLMAISALFGQSIDELLSHEVSKAQSDFLCQSVTEYDIAEPKHYDMDLGGAARLVLSGYDGEKLRVRLASNTLTDLERNFKVRIDDVKSRIDVTVLRKNGLTEAAAKEALTVFVEIPSPYLGQIETDAHAETVEVRNLECDRLEFNVKTKKLELDRVSGTVEIDCNLDMDILCRTLEGRVELNQIAATSRIRLPETAEFSTVCKGLANRITFEGDAAETVDAGNVIELNGLKSELVICPAEGK